MPMLMTTPGLHSKLSVVLTHARNVSIYPLVVWGDFAADCHSASKLHYQAQENCMKRADRIIRSKKHLADNLFWMLNPVALYRKKTRDVQIQEASLRGNCIVYEKGAGHPLCLSLCPFRDAVGFAADFLLQIRLKLPSQQRSPTVMFDVLSWKLHFFGRFIC